MVRLSNTTWRRLITAAIFAAAAAVVPSMFRAGADLWAQSGPVAAVDPSSDTSICDQTYTSYIQVWLWDSTSGLWGRRCAGLRAGASTPDIILSGEGDVIALPTSFVSSVANLAVGASVAKTDTPAGSYGNGALLDFLSTDLSGVPNLPPLPDQSGAFSVFVLKSSTSCPDPVNGIDTVAGCGKTQPTVCEYDDTDCNGNLANVTRADVIAPDS